MIRIRTYRKSSWFLGVAQIGFKPWQCHFYCYLRWISILQNHEKVQMANFKPEHFVKIKGINRMSKIMFLRLHNGVSLLIAFLQFHLILSMTTWNLFLRGWHFARTIMGRKQLIWISPSVIFICYYEEIIRQDSWVVSSFFP